MPTYRFKQPSGNEFQYIADTYKEASKGAQIMAPGSVPVIKPLEEITAPLGSEERSRQLLERGKMMLETLSPVGKVVAEAVKEEQKEMPRDLAVDLAKVADETIKEETKNYILSQPDWQDLFNQALKAGGMDEIKNEVSKIQKEVDRIMQQYNEDVGKIEENPFMSNQTKIKNIQRLKALTNADLKPLLDQYERLKDRTAEIVRGAERTLGFMEKAYRYETAEQERVRQEAARLRDDARALIQQYISTGAIGDFTDEQLQEIVDWGVGYGLKPLKALRSAVKQGSEIKLKKALAYLEAKARAARGSISELRAEDYDKVKQKAIQLFEADRARNKDKKVNPDLYGEVRTRIPASLRDDFDKWVVEMGYLSDETKRRFGIPIKEKKSVLEKTKEVLQQYKDVGFSRKELEAMYKKENNLESIPSAIKNIFDELYGVEQKPWYKRLF